jgi:hypothetical protein
MAWGVTLMDTMPIRFTGKSVKMTWRVVAVLHSHEWMDLSRDHDWQSLRRPDQHRRPDLDRVHIQLF